MYRMIPLSGTVFQPESFLRELAALWNRIFIKKRAKSARMHFGEKEFERRMFEFDFDAFPKKEASYVQLLNALKHENKP